MSRRNVIGSSSVEDDVLGVPGFGVIFYSREDVKGVPVKDAGVFLEIRGFETVSEIIKKINGSVSDIPLFFEKNPDIFDRHLQTISSIEELSIFSAQYFSLEVLREDGEHYFVSGGDQYPKAKENLNIRLQEFPKSERTLFSPMEPISKPCW